MTEPESLLTVGEIARRLRQPLHRVEYVFRDADLVRVASELKRIDRERDASLANRMVKEDEFDGI